MRGKLGRDCDTIRNMKNPWFSPFYWMLRARLFVSGLTLFALIWGYQGGPLLLFLAIGFLLLGWLTDAAGFFCSAELLAAGFLLTVFSAFWWNAGMVAEGYVESRVKNAKHREFIIGNCIWGIYLGMGHVYFCSVFWAALCSHIARQYTLEAGGGWAYHAIAFFFCVMVPVNRFIRMRAHATTETEWRGSRVIFKGNMCAIVIFFPIFTYFRGSTDYIFGWILRFF